MQATTRENPLIATCFEKADQHPKKNVATFSTDRATRCLIFTSLIRANLLNFMGVRMSMSYYNFSA